MRQFQLVTEDLENRAELMSRVRVRLDVDVDGLAREALGMRLRAIVNVCRGCRRPACAGGGSTARRAIAATAISVPTRSLSTLIGTD
jgi:hypothetical protein